MGLSFVALKVHVGAARFDLWSEKFPGALLVSFNLVNCQKHKDDHVWVSINLRRSTRCPRRPGSVVFTTVFVSMYISVSGRVYLEVVCLKVSIFLKLSLSLTTFIVALHLYLQFNFELKSNNTNGSLNSLSFWMCHSEVIKMLTFPGKINWRKC